MFFNIYKVLEHETIDGASSKEIRKKMNCNKCGNKLSRNTEYCPKCNTPTKLVKIKPCRSCGKMLEVNKYLKTAYFSRVEEGTSTTYSYRQHYPCPNCGEPKPFQNIILDTFIGKVILYTSPVWITYIIVKYILHTPPGPDIFSVILPVFTMVLFAEIALVWIYKLVAKTCFELKKFSTRQLVYGGLILTPLVFLLFAYISETFF